MEAHEPPRDELRRVAYVKSSYSSGAQECVMVTAAVGGWVGVQDSKTYAATPAERRVTLGFQRAAFAALLSTARHGSPGQPD
jgi:hypothetical protein